ncbi:MAG TPA: FoF1 ATP synthase subunit gamma [Candidatus Saccharimonadales bacterium]|nr:FoF1 ATP synthase subunit gamma [Candidatus Saccharimonadales bacterium]
MKRPQEIAREEKSMATLTELTSAFEGIASMRISQIKDQVLQSTRFFNELWGIYSQIHVKGDFRFGRDRKVPPIDKELYIVITAEGGFSGDIDQKLVRLVLDNYDAAKNDVLVIGHHGAAQLAQNNVTSTKYFKMPVKDRNINVMPIIREVQRYKSTKVFYQEYVSLMVQEVKYIELSTAVQEKGGGTSQTSKEAINEDTYIFEPSVYSVAAHLERSMMQIAISQVILESKLAQYASRFRAMSASRQRADQSKGELHLQYNRARRGVKDERLKEIINGMKKART